MSQQFTLEAKSRANLGKGASRRLRRLEDSVPAIMYGADKEPTPVTLSANELAKAIQNEAFFTNLVTINVDGNPEKVVVKDMQRHPAKEYVMHVDLLRISEDKKITLNVPLHITGGENSPGVKIQGGSVQIALQDLEISCLPKDLPEFIEVDMSELKAGQNIHISTLQLPEGVESVSLSHGADHDLLVCGVLQPRGGKAADIEDDAPAAEGEADAE